MMNCIGFLFQFYFGVLHAPQADESESAHCDINELPVGLHQSLKHFIQFSVSVWAMISNWYLFIY